MSAVQQFHYKLHHEEIKLENVKSLFARLSSEWSLIKPCATTGDAELVEQVEDLFYKVSKNFMEHSPMANGRVVSDEMHGDFRRVTSWVSASELLSLPRGFGGRIGVVLYTPDKYIFNVSNWDLISDFGGGLKARYTPYQGLCRKLRDECPQWRKYIVSRITGPDVRISCIETFHRYSESRTKSEMRFQFLVFIRFDMKMLETFQPTDKVKRVMIVPKDKLHEVIASGKANPGLVQLSKVKFV